MEQWLSSRHGSHDENRTDKEEITNPVSQANSLVWTMNFLSSVA